MNKKMPQDFIDAGATDDEPVTERWGIKQGNLNDWQDEIDSLKLTIFGLEEQLKTVVNTLKIEQSNG